MSMKKIESNQRKFAKKDAKNKRVELDALSDPDTLFGRAEKAMGDGWFSIVAQNKDHRGELIAGLRARIGGKSVARILINDIVIIDKCGKHYEILGSVSSKGAKELVKEMRIPAGLLVVGKTEVDEEGGVEFEEDGNNEDASNDAEEGELDINAI